MDLATVGIVLDNQLTQAGLRVSPLAKQILAQCIFAVTEDPEPSWTLPPPRSLDIVQSDAIVGVAVKLTRLVNTMKHKGIYIPEQIPTFTILHHLSSWIDHLCPFEKPT